MNFNSQPHEEADILGLDFLKRCGYFNSQPHEEADVEPPNTNSMPVTFQLTASRRG